MANIVKDGAIPADSVVGTRAYKELIPRIEKTAKGIAALCNLNRAVHLPTYTRVIADEAVKLHA